VLDALRDRLRPPALSGPAGAAPEAARNVPGGMGCSPSTRAFLSGQYASGPRWNDRLFRAACDLAGRDVGLDVAEPLLLAGADPWNPTEEDTARRTIRSAYSAHREPGRL